MVRIPLRASRMLFLVLAAMHVAGAVSAFVAFGSPWAWAITGMLLASLWWHGWRGVLRQSGSAVTAIALQGTRCEIELRDGTQVQARVLGSTFVSPLLTVVNLRLESGRRRSLVLAPDSADADDFRQLRVWLKHGLRDGEATSGTL